MIIAVDFDGTIVTHEYPRVGIALPGAFAWLHNFQSIGARLILLTMRSEHYLDEAVKLCADNGIHFWAVNNNPEQAEWTTSRKVYANLYIDDAALGCPLTEVKGQRPFVDWRVVGPRVMAMLRRWNLSSK